MSAATLAPGAVELALDLERVAPLVEPFLPPGAALTSATLLDRKEGRALLRYGLEGEPAGGSAYVLAKLYSDPVQARRVDRTLRLLGAEVFGPSPGLAVPRPLGVVAQPALLVYEPVDGVRLDLLPEFSAVPAAREGARWLAELHLSRVRLDRHLDVSHEVGNAGLWAALALQRLGPSVAGATEVVSRLEAGWSGLPPTRDVPIHKDFHHAHVLVGRQLSVVDLDEARMGDPAFDLAHFCANLRLMRPPGAGAASATALEEAFLEEYATRTGWEADGRFAFFYALNCVKLMKQIATGRGPAGALDSPEREDRAALVVEEGLAWSARW